MNFFDELACALACEDSPALGAWLKSRMAAQVPALVAAADAFWDKADDEEKYAIGLQLGWSDPTSADEKPRGVPPGVMNDFVALDAMAWKLAFPDGRS